MHKQVYRTFCKIKLCKYEVGTTDKSIKFFRVPTKGHMRKKWIEAISQYQDFDYYSARFSLCQLHFNENDYEIKQCKAILKKGTVPTIFGRPENMLTMNTDAVRFRNDPEPLDIVPKIEPYDNSYNDPLAMPTAPNSSQPYQMPEGQMQSMDFDCKGCTKLHIELLNALERIHSLEESLHHQGKALANHKRLLASFKEENGKLKAERYKWRCNDGHSETANSIN